MANYKIALEKVYSFVVKYLYIGGRIMLNNNHHITVTEANEMINKLIGSSKKEAEVFISLLSEKYIQEYGIQKDKFIRALSDNLDKLENQLL